MFYSQKKLLIEGLLIMANLADNVVALQTTVDSLVTIVNGLVTQVAAIAAPTVDLSTVAKADALAAVAVQVADIDSKVTPTVGA